MNIPARVSYSRPQNHQGWRAEIHLKYGVKRDKTRLIERRPFRGGIAHHEARGF